MLVILSWSQRTWLAQLKDWKRGETASLALSKDQFILSIPRPMRRTNCQEAGEATEVYVLVVLHSTLLELL